MAEALKAEGNECLKSKDFDGAIAKYTEAIALDASNRVYFSNRSAAYLSKGDAAAALADAEEVIRLDPTWAKGHSRKGAALHSLKRWDDACLAYEKGLKACPGDASLQRGLEDVRRQRDQATNPMKKLFGPELLTRLAAHPKYRGWLADEAFTAKLQLLMRDPESAMRTGMADPQLMEVIQFALGIPMAAEEAPPAPSEAPKAEEPPEEPPVELSEEEKADLALRERANAAKARGNELYKAKDFAGALAAYDEAISIDPREMLYVNNKAAVFMEMKEYERALETCDAAVAVGREHRAPYESLAKPFVRKAKIYKAMGDLDEAVRQFQLAQREHRDRKIEREIKLIQLEAKERAKKAYLSPELAQEAKARGNEAFRAGDFAKAVEEYEEAAKRDPRDAPIRNNLAAALQKIGDFNGALREVKKALDFDANYVKAWAKRGDIEFFMKENHKAMESYQRGLAIDDANSACRAGLQRVMQSIQSQQGVDEERVQHALADPEIQQILADPVVNQVIRDFKENPAAAQAAMRDPGMSAKLNKLVAAGVLGTA